MDSIPTPGNEILISYFYFFALVTRQSATLNFTTHQEMSPKLGGKCGTEMSKWERSILRQVPRFRLHTFPAMYGKKLLQG